MPKANIHASGFVFFCCKPHLLRVFDVGRTFTGTSAVLWWQLLSLTSQSFYLPRCQSAEPVGSLCSEEVPPQSRLFRVSAYLEQKKYKLLKKHTKVRRSFFQALTHGCASRQQGNSIMDLLYSCISRSTLEPLGFQEEANRFVWSAEEQLARNPAALTGGQPDGTAKTSGSPDAKRERKEAGRDHQGEHRCTAWAHR